MTTTEFVAIHLIVAATALLLTWSTVGFGF